MSRDYDLCKIKTRVYFQQKTVDKYSVYFLTRGRSFFTFRVMHTSVHKGSYRHYTGLLTRNLSPSGSKSKTETVKDQESRTVMINYTTSRSSTMTI